MRRVKATGSKNRSAALARSITWSASKHSFLIAGLLVDPQLRDDCYRAYAYFRWADDVVDEPGMSESERVAFIERQRDLVRQCYEGQTSNCAKAEEQMIVDLIRGDRNLDSGLRSFIWRFLDILEFDAQRKGQLVSRDQLLWYSSHLGRAVTDGIQYFIGSGHAYPDASNRHLAATGAHITHMLRDMVSDIPEGFINVPLEELGDGRIDINDLNADAFRGWVREQVSLARQHFALGKQYIDSLDVLRCKLAAYWYCTRFEVVLDAIELDGFVLRAEYDERRKSAAFFKMAYNAIETTMKHVLKRPPQDIAKQKEVEL